MQRTCRTMPKRNVVVAALVVMILLLAQSLAAQVGATYYVSTTGNDGNSGSIGAPWLTIQHAATKAKAGATVYVFGGVYNEFVNFPRSGTASAPITFQSYPGQTAVIDGTGVACCGSSQTQGLINITGARSYITINGFEIRNYTTSKPPTLPVASGSPVQARAYRFSTIWCTTSPPPPKRRQRFRHGVYATSKTPITQLVISGNEVYDNRTGNSETLTINGNVTHFQVTNNLVHDNDNIGIDAIGFEGVGPVGYDQPMYGEMSGNTVYNISGITNPGEGYEYDADGFYCDGCAYLTIERNVILQVDYGIETTSENQICQPNGTEWSGPNNTGKAAKGKSPCYGRYVTVRNNLFYNANSCGNSIGGYAPATKKGGPAMEAAAATTKSSSTTLCTTTAPSPAVQRKARPAASSRFRTRSAALKGTFTKTTFCTPEHPISGSTATHHFQRRIPPHPRPLIGTCITRVRAT